MLQLQRTLQCSTSLSLGHLTTGPSWPSMPSQERCNRPEYFYLAADSLPEPAKYSVGKVPRASRLSAVPVASRPHLPAVPTARLQYSTRTDVLQGGTGGNSSPVLKHGDSLLALVEILPETEHAKEY